jgi:hypothetical protein
MACAIERAWIPEEETMRSRAWLVAAFLLVGCDDEDAGMDSGMPEARGDAGHEDAGAVERDEDAGLDGGAPREDGGVVDGGRGECAPAEVLIGASCPALTPCGGELAEGDYCHAGLCVARDELLAPLLTRYCAGIVVEEATGSATGRVSLAGGAMEWHSVAILEVRALFPAVCVVNGCDEIATLVEREIVGSSATCASVADQCRCELTIEASVDSVDGYVVDPGAGVITVGTERRYDYCIEADGSIRMRGGPADHGTWTLAPRP